MVASRGPGKYPSALQPDSGSIVVDRWPNIAVGRRKLKEMGRPAIGRHQIP